MNKKSKFIFPILLFIILFFSLTRVSSWYENKLRIEENKVILSELKAHRTSILESIDKRFIILTLLKKYVERNINNKVEFDLKNKDLLYYSKVLYESVNGIKALQVSPKGVHTFVYPFKGNEKTFNRNLFEDERIPVIEALKLTMNSKDIITNAPYKLRQGSFGLVARQAVRDKDEFWGFVVMVLDMNNIFKEIGMGNKNSKLHISIYQDKKYIFGDRDLNDENFHKIPLTIANQKLTLIAGNKTSLDYLTLKVINLSILIISILSGFILYILLNKQIKLESSVIKSMDELKKKTKELRKLSTTDALTQIYNRAKLDELIEREISVSKRTNNVFYLIMIDLDFFKEVNDNYGHLIGDEVLIEFSQIIKESIREIDYLGRWGGEEFLIISQNSDEKEVLIWLNRIKDRIEKHVFTKGIKKTASFGVTKYKKNDTLPSIIKRADDALYESKDSGRNTIRIKNI